MVFSRLFFWRFLQGFFTVLVLLKTWSSEPWKSCENLNRQNTLGNKVSALACAIWNLTSISRVLPVKVIDMVSKVIWDFNFFQFSKFFPLDSGTQSDGWKYQSCVIGFLGSYGGQFLLKLGYKDMFLSYLINQADLQTLVITVFTHIVQTSENSDRYNRNCWSGREDHWWHLILCLLKLLCYNLFIISYFPNLTKHIVKNFKLLL